MRFFAPMAIWPCRSLWGWRPGKAARTFPGPAIAAWRRTCSRASARRRGSRSTSDWLPRARASIALRPCSGSRDQHVEPVAETLHVGRCGFFEARSRVADLRPRPDLSVRTSSRFMRKLSRSSAGVPVCVDLAEVHQRDAMAALRFVQIRRGDDDRESFGGQCASVSQNSRRDTGSTPVVGSSSSRTAARRPARRPAPASASCRRSAVRPDGR